MWQVMVLLKVELLEMHSHNIFHIVGEEGKSERK